MVTGKEILIGCLLVVVFCTANHFGNGLVDMGMVFCAYVLGWSAKK